MAGNINKINLPSGLAPPALMACAVMSQKREPMKLDDIGKLAEGAFQTGHENSNRPSKMASPFFNGILRSLCAMIFKTQ